MEKQYLFDNKSLRINNLIAAIIICFSLINGAIGIDGISYATIAFVFVLALYGIAKKCTKIYKYPCLIVLYILLFFLFSLLTVTNTEYTVYYLKYFIGFCLISLFAGTQKIAIMKVLKYVEIIGLVCVGMFIVRGLGNYDASIQMGISYTMLPVFYAALINIKGKYYNRILSALNIIFILWCYIAVAPRGIWLNVAITIALYFFVMFGKSGTVKSKLILRFFLMFLGIIGIIAIYRYFGDILLWLSEWIYKITNVKVYALDKMVYLLNSRNLSNGRDDLVMLAEKLIHGHFVFGRGIGYFEVIQGTGGYVHNIIYQAICEAGAFFLIPLVVLSVCLLKYLLHIEKNQNQLEMSFFLLLLANGYVLLFYSSVYWKLLTFWFLVGYVIKIKNHLGIQLKRCIKM